MRLAQYLLRLLLSMLLFVVAILCGLVILVLSADRFVAAGAAIASNLGVPQMVVGITLISIGTSAPEIVTAIQMSLNGLMDMALGNAFGSNIANIGLVLGMTALIAPVPISAKAIGLSNLVAVGTLLLAGLFLYDLRLSRFEGAFLLLALVGFLATVYVQQSKQPVVAVKLSQEAAPQMSSLWALFWFTTGLLMLVVSARILVWGAAGIATRYDVSEAIIGATIVAIGTSLPELAASISSAIKKHHDLAVGNILGSNIFNLLAVVAMPALIAPGPLSNEVFKRDFAMTSALGVLFFVLLAVQGRRQASLNRYIGTIFVLTYSLYGYLVYQSLVR